MADLYQNAVTTLLAAVKEQITYVLAPGRAAFYETLVDLRVDARLYFLNPEMATLLIWPAIRETPAVMDLLVNITTNWFPRYVALEAKESQCKPAEAYSRLVEILTKGLSGFTARDRSNDRVTDQEFANKFAEEKPLTDLLQQEIWLVVLLLLTRNLSEFEKTIIAPAGKANA